MYNDITTRKQRMCKASRMPATARKAIMWTLTALLVSGVLAFAMWSDKYDMINFNLY